VNWGAPWSAKQWTEGKNSFKNDPPNAFLTQYDARILKGTPPSAGIESTLFIDGAGAPCDPQFDTGDAGYPCWAQQAFSAAQPG